MTSESTRFLGQPNEIKPTEGAVGAEVLVTYLLYRNLNSGSELAAGRSGEYRKLGGVRGLHRNLCKDIAFMAYKLVNAGAISGFWWGIYGDLEC